MGGSRGFGRGLGASSWEVDREVSRGRVWGRHEFESEAERADNVLVVFLFCSLSSSSFSSSRLSSHTSTRHSFGNTAAAFFTTYEYLKRTLSKNIDVLEQAPAANHLVSSMGAEIVSRFDVLPESFRRLTRYG